MLKIFRYVGLVIMALAAGQAAGRAQEGDKVIPADALRDRAISLEACRVLAEARYKPVQLAKEEIAVAEARVAEAARDLWPTLAAKAEHTNGAAIVELGTPGFREQSYGLQLTYTLFQGGRGWAAYRQANVNLRLTRAKYEKIRQETIYLATEAYWNLVRAQANIADYEEAGMDVRRYAAMAEHLFSGGTLMKKLLLGTNSQRNQSEYQIQSAQADLEKFTWKWAASLGWDKPPATRPQADIPFAPLEIKLDECLALAAEHNPEVRMQALLLEAGQYELETKNGSDWPKIELNGFYGRSGGAYNTEVLELREDYNFGVKLTQPVAWNTLALSGFQQKTSPKLGQSSRTEAQTVTAAFSILDGFKSGTEKAEAAFHLHTVEYNLEKSRQTADDEVREAYFNYRKALAQVRNAQLDVDLSRREWVIAKINLRDDKATLPEVAETRNKLAGTRVTLREARTFYLISLAALNKAVGITDKYTLPAQASGE